MDIIYSQQIYGRPFLAPSGLAQARVDELRAAFDAALKDPKLQSDAARMGMELRSMTGAQLQAVIEDLYATPPALLARARSALDPGAAMQNLPGSK
jgi:tripartite-type tricarboxylate transporter receptor subunit TctC